MTLADPRRTTPTAIAIEPSGGALRVTWRDGHETLLALLDLRRACPCATCGDEAKKRGDVGGASAPLAGATPPPATKPSALRMARGPALSDLALSRFAGVGRYAIQLFWADGHDTGIYSFELLRSLCRCEACRGSG